VEATTDGDDYMKERRRGPDSSTWTDDILGGSSDLRVATAEQRPDDADTIYGGAGTNISAITHRMTVGPVTYDALAQ
jgi:hypothetical protein